MAKVANGTAVLNHGTVDESWGYVENVEIGQEGEKEEVKNGAGDTTGTIHTDKKSKVTGTYTPLAAAQAGDPPKDSDLIGKTITIKTEGTSTIVAIVDSSKLTYTKGKPTGWSFEGYYYPNVSLA